MNWMRDAPHTVDVPQALLQQVSLKEAHQTFLSTLQPDYRTHGYTFTAVFKLCYGRYKCAAATTFIHMSLKSALCALHSVLSVLISPPTFRIKAMSGGPSSEQNLLQASHIHKPTHDANSNDSHHLPLLMLHPRRVPSRAPGPTGEGRPRARK